MRLLYIDVGSYKSHYNYNFGILRNLPETVRLDICAARDYIPKEAVHYFRYYEIPETCIYAFDSHRKYNQIYMRKTFAKAYIWVRRNVPFKKYDAVFWGYTECISFYFIFNRCRQKFLFLDHEIGNTVESHVKKWFFTHINKQYEFIAFEDYIKEYASMELHLKNRISVVRHPLPQIHIKAMPAPEDRFVLFAPALSSSEEFINLLIRFYRKIPKSVKIIIRSKKRTFSSESLEVYSEYISEKTYLSSMAACSAVLIHYGSDYNYRTSGVLYEAVTLRKPVYMYSGNTLDYYAQTYPDIIFPFYTDREFFTLINQAIGFCRNVKKESFDKILGDYSDEMVKKELKEVLERI